LSHFLCFALATTVISTLSLHDALPILVGQVQARLGHGRQGAQVLFDQPAAGGATDALDQQRGFRQLALVLHEGLLHLGAVVERRSEEHTSELQSRENLVCRLLLEKKKK